MVSDPVSKEIKSSPHEGKWAVIAGVTGIGILIAAIWYGSRAHTDALLPEEREARVALQKPCDELASKLDVLETQDPETVRGPVKAQWEGFLKSGHLPDAAVAALNQDGGTTALIHAERFDGWDGLAKPPWNIPNDKNKMKGLKAKFSGVDRSARDACGTAMVR